MNVKFKLIGIQWKNDKHGQRMDYNMSGENPSSISLNLASMIDCIRVEASPIHNIIEVWSDMCVLSKNLKCKVTCWFHDCNFLTSPESDPLLINVWCYRIMDYRILRFGPGAPKLTENVTSFVDRYKAYDRHCEDLTRELEETKKKRAEVIYMKFASDVDDEISMSDIPAGTPKVIKKNVNKMLKMLIGLTDKSKQKYLIDMHYDMSEYSPASSKGKIYRLQENIYNEWLESISEMRGNYGHNYEVAEELIKKYMMKKLNLSEEKYKETLISSMLTWFGCCH